MGKSHQDAGGTASNAGAFPKPDPALLKLHLLARHDLIPLNKPQAKRGKLQLGKVPRDARWLDRDYKREDAGAWMSAGYNVGVRLRHDQLAIDVDPRNFGDADSLAKLCRAFDLELGNFPQVLSGGGGRHLYMKKPTGTRINKVLPEFPGLEFVTRGRHLVAAGSVHPETAKHYRADDPLEYLIDPPEVPLNLLQAIARRSPAIASNSEEGELLPSQMAQMLSELDPIAFRDYQSKWLPLAMACHYATGGAGVDEFVEWARRDPKYAGYEDRNRAQWSTFKLDCDGGIKAGTLYKAVIDAGRGDLVEALTRTTAEQDFARLPGDLDALELKRGRDGNPTVNFTNCLAVLKNAGLGLAFDELARRSIARAKELPWQTDIGREVNDDMLRVIRHFLIEQFKMEFTKDNVNEAALTLAREAPFNPVVEHLSSMKWDGIERLDNWLVTYMGAEVSEYVRAVGRLVLIAAVRRAKSPGCKFDQVMILEGAQGTGKSSALKVLAGEWHSDAELGRLDSKEAPAILQGVWIHELGELTAMKRSEAEDLKAFVSRCEDRYREPYDKLPRTVPRRCIFIGTTNAATYLFDMTGNRRFWPVKTGFIDLNALKRDRNQLWAEAVMAEAAGTSIELAPDLWDQASKEQSARLAEDPWKDMIQEWLDGDLVQMTPAGPQEHPRRDRVHTRDVFKFLNIEAGRQNQQSAKRLRDVMRAIGGWTYKRGLRIGGAGTGAGYQRDGAADGDEPFGP